MTRAPQAKLARPPRHRSRRRGAVYLLTLYISVIITIIGLGALAVTRVQGRMLADTNDYDEATVLAESAVEVALAQVNGAPNWRTQYQSGVESARVASGRGTISWKFVDEADGNLADDGTQPVRLYGIGRVGRAAKAFSVVAAAGRPLSCLGVALSAAGNLSFQAPRVTSSATASSNGSITSTNGDLDGLNLEASGTITISASAGTGTRKQAAPARAFPNANTVFTKYVDEGTIISIGSVVTSGQNKTIVNMLFSPNSNPFGGSTNPKGVYVIDCQGWNVTVSNCRVVGTLVLLNTGAASAVQNTVNFAPAVVGYPSLLVKGDMQFKLNQNVLSDNASTPINYNPPGTPYNGASDTTFTTTYPNEVRGLVYVSGALAVGTLAQFHGCVVVGGSISVGGSLVLTLDPSITGNPPPGFTDPGVITPSAGSWQWVAAQ